MTVLWDIVNPSDRYTLRCEEHLTAAVAVCFLGKGQYALEELDGDRRVPLFLFGGVDEWFGETFGLSFEAAVAQVGRDKVADALDSVMIGSPATRWAYETALAHIPTEEGRAAYRAEVQEQQRSSLNNIGRRAWALAKSFRGAS